MSLPALEARELHRFYRQGDAEVAALKDVSFSVAPGETVAVMGPSGSGKSTLLALLAGLDDPDGGSVWLGACRLSHQTPRRQAALRASELGMLTQSSGLVEHLSVLGNVKLAAKLRARGRGRSADRGAGPAPLELLEQLGLQKRVHGWPGTLSGGETARANLAVALAGSPTVLLADEPTAEVSQAEELSVLALLKQLRPSSGATVIVTHSAAVASYADRVLCLERGRLL